MLEQLRESAWYYIFVNRLDKAINPNRLNTAELQEVLQTVRPSTYYGKITKADFKQLIENNSNEWGWCDETWSRFHEAVISGINAYEFYIALVDYIAIGDCDAGEIFSYTIESARATVGLESFK